MFLNKLEDDSDIAQIGREKQVPWFESPLFMLDSIVQYILFDTEMQFSTWSVEENLRLKHGLRSFKCYLS